MRAQVLDRTLRAYRIGDPDGLFAVFGAEGSRLFPGRWNDAEHPVMYAAEHLSTAMLEKLAANHRRMPLNQHFVEIEIDASLTYEVFDAPAHPGWDSPRPDVAQGFGGAWARERRSLALLVPSVVARTERNVLINPAHPDFPRVRHGLHRPISWDDRLFAPG